MIPAEQWQKEAGTYSFRGEWGEEEQPHVSLDLIKRIQVDAWQQGIKDGAEFEHYMDAFLKRGPQ